MNRTQLCTAAAAALLLIASGGIAGAQSPSTGTVVQPGAVNGADSGASMPHAANRMHSYGHHARHARRSHGYTTGMGPSGRGGGGPNAGNLTTGSGPKGKSE